MDIIKMIKNVKIVMKIVKNVIKEEMKLHIIVFHVKKINYFKKIKEIVLMIVWMDIIKRVIIVKNVIQIVKLVIIIQLIVIHVLIICF